MRDPLSEAAARRHELTRARAVQALRELDRAGAPVTFAGVAQAAGISRSWLYTQPDISSHIRRLREKADGAGSAGAIPAGQRATETSLRARLTAALDRNKQLADENARLRRQLARALGDQRCAGVRSGNDPKERNSQDQAASVPSATLSTTGHRRSQAWLTRKLKIMKALGMAGQVTYHLLAGAGVTRAPWAITTIVSCLPVLVLAMGTTLAHLLRDDARTARSPSEQPGLRSASWSPADQSWPRPDQQTADGPVMPDPPAAAGGPSVRDRLAAARTSGPDQRAESSPAEHARLVARQLAVAGKPVSRRALRSGGVRGSNEALNSLARELNAERAVATAPAGI